MTQIADTVEEITPEWLTDALRDGGVLPEGSRVTGAESELQSTGQLGHVARMTLDYEGERDGAPDTLMVKLPRADEGSRQIGVVLGTYEGEVRFYKEIASTVK